MEKNDISQIINSIKKDKMPKAVCSDILKLFLSPVCARACVLACVLVHAYAYQGTWVEIRGQLHESVPSFHLVGLGN